MCQARPRILIVEDDLLIALDIARVLDMCNCDAIGPVGSVVDAMGAVHAGRMDAALLDVNLRDGLVWPVADLLTQLRIPFVIATGWSAGQIPEKFGARPMLAKPLTPQRLDTALREIGALPP